jgi:uncharacterized protein (DUF983 family)
MPTPRDGDRTTFHSTRTSLGAVFRQRCPQCRRGPIFATLTAVHPRCPACGFSYEREPGYFVGAMYFSYGLAVLILVPLYFLLHWLLPDWDNLLIASLSLLAYLPLTLGIYRYSRVLWMYFDQ